ncbi:MAG: dihydrofolate reductase [Gammaproteobacteria bacterium]|nr:MAG: dihydrofolate reductase [Gammaproteobacteria bacterium]
MSRNRVIGVKNHLPWHLPGDMKFFKETTSGHHIITGRKNYEDIGKPLPNRTNIVVTTDKNFVAPGCIVANNLEDALKAVKNDNEVFIIGGAKIYEQMLPRADRIYLTLIDAEIPGDTYFPDMNFEDWQEISRQEHVADDKNAYSFTILTLDRKHTP